MTIFGSNLATKFEDGLKIPFHLSFVTVVTFIFNQLTCSEEMMS